MTVILSERTTSRLERVFRNPRDREQAIRLLERECSDNLPLWNATTPVGLERVRFAVLKISGGDLTALAGAVAQARVDWRDALVAAGFADDVEAHLAWHPE